MAKVKTVHGPTLDEIKRLVIIGMFSDDVLMEQIVVKGGNALDIILGISTRGSVDVDFSLAGDLPGDFEVIKARIERALRGTFESRNLVVFDFLMIAKPSIVSAEIAEFWGGYGIEFKLIDKEKFLVHRSDLESLRRNALPLGQSTKFLIDISRFEFTTGKIAHQLDGFRVYAYSPAMIAIEKLRALCQQMPEYGAVVKRSRAGTARARDFLDLYTVVSHFDLDILSESNVDLLRAVFAAKKVPLSLLNKLVEYRDFHRADWPGVLVTVRPGQQVQNFDFYFDFVLSLISKLEPLWNK